MLQMSAHDDTQGHTQMNILIQYHTETVNMSYEGSAAVYIQSLRNTNLSSSSLTGINHTIELNHHLNDFKMIS